MAAGAVGGGIFAKTAKTPPLQSGVCGDIIAIRIVLKGRPLVPPCVYHAAHGDPGFYHDAAPNRDAARHVATNALPPYAHARPTATVCAYHATPHASHLWRPYGLYSDAARRVATVFE